MSSSDPTEAKKKAFAFARRLVVSWRTSLTAILLSCFLISCSSESKVNVPAAAPGEEESEQGLQDQDPDDYSPAPATGPSHKADSGAGLALCCVPH